MNDVELERRARHLDLESKRLAQELLDAGPHGEDYESRLAQIMAFQLAMVAAGRALQLSDNQLAQLFDNALLRVRAVVMGKAAGNA